MKLVSRFALALSLAAVAHVPASQAADKKEEKQSKKPGKKQYSPGFTAAYKPAIDALNKTKDYPAAKALWPSVLAAATTDDDKYEAGVFAVNLAVKLQDAPLQREGIKLFLESKSTPAADRPAYEFKEGLFVYSDKDYAKSQQMMEAAYNTGYREANAEFNIASAYRMQEKLPEALAWIQRAVDGAVAAGKKPEARWYTAGFSYALRAKDNTAILQWGMEMIKADPRPETYHDALMNFIAKTDMDNAEGLDALRLARRTGSLLYIQEYSQYLEYLDYNRYPSEAIAVIDEGIKKGIIPKNNGNFVEIRAAAEGKLPELSNNRALDEKAARDNPKGYLALLTADGLFSFGEYAVAQSLYETALSKGALTDKDGIDQTDRALTHLALAKANQGDLAGAKAELLKITGPKRKAVAAYWLVYLDQQLQPVTAPATAATN